MDEEELGQVELLLRMKRGVAGENSGPVTPAGLIPAYIDISIDE